MIARMQKMIDNKILQLGCPKSNQKANLSHECSVSEVNQNLFSHLLLHFSENLIVRKNQFDNGNLVPENLPNFFSNGIENDQKIIPHQSHSTHSFIFDNSAQLKKLISTNIISSKASNNQLINKIENELFKNQDINKTFTEKTATPGVDSNSSLFLLKNKENLEEIGLSEISRHFPFDGGNLMYENPLKSNIVNITTRQKLGLERIDGVAKKTAENKLQGVDDSGKNVLTESEGFKNSLISGENKIKNTKVEIQQYLREKQNTQKGENDTRTLNVDLKEFERIEVKIDNSKPYKGITIGISKEVNDENLNAFHNGYIRVVDIPSKVAKVLESNKEYPIKAEIHLQPKWLGIVIVEINVVKDKVEVIFKSENKEGLQILESQIGHLKEKLQNLGFEKQNISFQNLTEDNENSFGTFSNKQGKQEDEELRRKFIQSFLKLRNNNENFVINEWGDNDYQH